jgi:hypothetical protein
MEEMRRLRKEDPVMWSVTALAKRFDCSRIFVSFVTEGLSEEKQKQQKMVTEVIKSRWGSKRRVAREDRALRKERWYSDSWWVGTGALVGYTQKYIRLALAKKIAFKEIYASLTSYWGLADQLLVLHCAAQEAYPFTYGTQHSQENEDVVWIVVESCVQAPVFITGPTYTHERIHHHHSNRSENC